MDERCGLHELELGGRVAKKGCGRGFSDTARH